MSLKFEWNPRKAASNLRKHGVPFEEAMTVFGDPLAAIFTDESHSIVEERELIIGHSDRNRLLLVSFTERNGTVRIIGARRATRREREDDEENRNLKNAKRSATELQREYQFDYRQARPNRFAARYKQGGRVILLDPDIARVFTTPESVNSVLRALLETMPRRKSRQMER